MSGAEVTRISLQVDSTSAKTAEANLTGMAVAGKTAAQALTSTEASARTAADALTKSAAGAAAIGAAQAKVGQGAKSAADGFKSVGQSAAMSAQQTLQLSNQLQDFFVQVQSGGSPLTALIQQGSQLSAVFGGVRPALSAVASVVFTTATAYATLAAAGVGLGAAFLIGREQSAELQRTLTLTGNAAGVSEGQFNALAKSISDSTKTTIGSTRDTLLALTASGRISGDTLSQAATAAQLLGKVTGQSADDIVKSFASAADAPAKFAEETNRSYNFLTAKQLDYIRNLSEQGRQQEALAQTFALLIPRLEESATKTTGLAGAFGEAKREVSSFIDGLVNLGREETAEDRIASIRTQLEELAKSGQKGFVFGPSAAELQSQLDGLNRTADGERKAAAAAQVRAQTEQSLIAFGKLREQTLTRQQQLTKALENANTLADKAGLSQADRAPVLAGIRRQFDNGQNKAQLDADLATIKASENARLAVYKTSETVLDALRAAGQVRDGDYYQAKRAFVDLDTQAQERALNAEIARLQAFKGSASENIEATKQIGLAREKLAEIQAGAAAKTVILGVQERSAVDALKRSFDELGFSAVASLAAISRANARRVADVGRSDNAREQAAAEASVIEQSNAALQRLDADYRNGRLRGKKDQYERERQLLLDNREFELEATRQGYADLAAAQADWTTGAARAFQQYADTAANTSSAVESLLSNAFKGAEDALISFSQTGKLNFSSFANSIIADILRIQIRKSIASSIGGGGGMDWLSTAIGFFGLASGSGNNVSGQGLLPTAGGRANGGPVSAGKLYEVNETGRSELLNVGGRQYLMAGRDGTVTAANQIGGGGGVQQNITFVTSSTPDRRSQNQMAAVVGRAVQTASARNG